MPFKFIRKVVAVLVIAVAVFGAGNSLGHFLGGSFNHTSGSVLTLEYTTNGLWQGYWGVGVSAWNNTPTSVNLVPGSLSTSEIDLYGGTYMESWWGATTLQPCASCSPYTKAKGYLNTQTLSGETNLIKNKVATHELGHAFGLEHAPGNASYKSVMKQGALTYSDPQSHDVNDISQLYP